MCLHVLPHLIKTNFGYPYNKGKENREEESETRASWGGKVEFNSVNKITTPHTYLITYSSQMLSLTEFHPAFDKSL